MAKKVHITGAIHSSKENARYRTLCGRDIRGLTLIKNGSIREATCLVCLGSDDRLQILAHQRECAAAKIDPNTLEPIHRGRD
jgi:hypothetical protein